MIYLDSSALLKLLLREAETEALGSWLSQRRAVPAVGSELAKVEVERAVRRVFEPGVPAARALLSGLDLVPLSGRVVEAAAQLGDPGLRSLGALHLASALLMRADLTAFVAYDLRLLAAARDAGLEVAHPGASA